MACSCAAISPYPVCTWPCAAQQRLRAPRAIATQIPSPHRLLFDGERVRVRGSRFFRRRESCPSPRRAALDGERGEVARPIATQIPSPHRLLFDGERVRVRGGHLCRPRRGAPCRAHRAMFMLIQLSKPCCACEKRGARSGETSLFCLRVGCGLAAPRAHDGGGPPLSTAGSANAACIHFDRGLLLPVEASHDGRPGVAPSGGGLSHPTLPIERAFPHLLKRPSSSPGPSSVRMAASIGTGPQRGDKSSKGSVGLW